MQTILSPTKYSRKSKPAIVGEVLTTYVRPRLEDCKKITSSREVYEALKDWEGIDLYESFKAIFVNRANYMVAGPVLISQGGVSGTVADPKIIFQKALAANASGLMLAHNHPSGALRPSQADIDLTKKLKEAGRFLEIQVMDHVILTSDGKYFSFADEGML